MHTDSEEYKIYLIKKETVLSSLNSLKWHWKLAEPLLDYLNKGWEYPELIEEIIWHLDKAVDLVKDDNAREKMKKWLDFLNEMRKKEEDEKIKEWKEIENLDSASVF